MKKLWIEIGTVYVICFALTAANIFIGGRVGSPLSDIIWAAAVFSLFAVPLIAVRRIHPRGEAEAGVTVSWSWRDLAWGAAAVLMICVPVALANHVLRTDFLGMDFRFAWDNYARLQQPLCLEILLQILCVALPEEFFYRGYIQTNILKCLKSSGTMAKYAPAAAIVIASALFALVHFPNGGAVRLLTFFPGLLFGFLRYKSGGIIGAVFCHASCNLMMIVYNVHYF